MWFLFMTVDIRTIIREALSEMAPPIGYLSSKDWYHGASPDRIASIMHDGYLKPSDLVKKGSRSQMAPQFGKVYLTHDIVEGIGYAFFRAGAHMSSDRQDKGSKAYLVVVDGGALKDVEPDEDIIADLLPDYDSNMENGRHKFQWLRDMATRYAPKAFQKYERMGDYAYGTALGKTLMKYLTDDQKIELITHGKKMAHGGEIPIREVWELDIANKAQYKERPDGFRKFSKRIY